MTVMPKRDGTDQRLQTVTTNKPTIMTETMQKTSLVMISAFLHHLSFSSSSPDPQGECESDSDKDSKYSK
jgi:hypothetical protein